MFFSLNNAIFFVTIASFRADFGGGVRNELNVGSTELPQWYLGCRRIDLLKGHVIRVLNYFLPECLKKAISVSTVKLAIVTKWDSMVKQKEYAFAGLVYNNIINTHYFQGQ